MLKRDNMVLKNEGMIKKILNNKWNIIIIIGLSILLFVIFYFIYKQTIRKYKETNINDENKEETIDEEIANKKVEMMLFFTTWCPHCKSCKPDWEKLKETYENRLINGYKVEFIDVDCTNETTKTEQLMNQYKVEGYPTIILVKDGKTINFDAKPSFETLDQFLNTVI
jgi:thiol-disulfide isomerase/thioredoxin